jgi:hypothetical protein
LQSVRSGIFLQTTSKYTRLAPQHLTLTLDRRTEFGQFIIDGPALCTADYKLDLGAGIDSATGKFTHHGWMLSDGLMLSYLFLCGVPPEKVKRYIAPWPDHIVYVIDTRGVDAYREANASFIKAKFLI